MNMFDWMGLCTTIALFLPIVIILLCKLGWYKSFPGLLVYYTVIFGFNFMQLGYLKVNEDLLQHLGTFSNMLDAPLMLFFLTYFSQTASFRKKLYALITGFVAFEILIASIYGLTIKATTIIMAPGLLLVLTLALIFFIHQVKIAVVHHKALGKAVMITSILFAYVGYSFVYVVYYLLESPQKNDTYIVYFLITIASSISLATGIIFERKRVKKLDELQTTRKELQDIYGSANNGKKTTVPVGTAVLNFDSDQWN